MTQRRRLGRCSGWLKERLYREAVPTTITTDSRRCTLVLFPSYYSWPTAVVAVVLVSGGISCEKGKSIP